MELTQTNSKRDGRVTQTLWVCLTRTCNFDCSYCYQGSHAEIGAGLTRTMDDRVLEAAAPWLTSWTSAHLSVVWYGGEPLLAFPLIERWLPRLRVELERAGKAVSFSCTTNGSLLTEHVREVLDEHRVGILLSLDGPPHLHDQSRVYYDTDALGRRRGTWSSIPIDEILAWRPDVEIAWQLSPGIPFAPADLDWMIERGFRHINFNLQWLEEWSGDARIRLEEFFRYVGRVCIQGKLSSNWKEKLDRALTVDSKMVQPCGTGLAMLGLSPEGWLYPSQEMVYTSVQPGRAPGTAEHYRVGDVFRKPVIDLEVLRRVSAIRTEQMRPPAPFVCENCVARSVSIGGCHCRYIGQDGLDPANRFDVLPGYCQSMVSAMTGLVQAAAIERYVRPVEWLKTAGGGAPCAGGEPARDAPLQIRGRDGAVRRPAPEPVTLETLARQLGRLERRIEELDVVRLETIEEGGRN